MIATHERNEGEKNPKKEIFTEIQSLLTDDEKMDEFIAKRVPAENRSEAKKYFPRNLDLLVSACNADMQKNEKGILGVQMLNEEIDYLLTELCTACVSRNERDMRWNIVDRFRTAYIAARALEAEKRRNQ